tara:strand:- start:81 stop:368 length:288 start_codon:yes stop_codon:yes gene_type:complete
MFWLLVFTLIVGVIFITPSSNPDDTRAYIDDKDSFVGCLTQLIGCPLYYGSAYLLHYFFDVLSSLTFGWFTFVLIMGHFLIFLFSSQTKNKNEKK